jgi:hypothetical protein
MTAAGNPTARGIPEQRTDSLGNELRKLIFTHKGVINHKLHVLYFITGRGKSDGENPQQLHIETFANSVTKKIINVRRSVFFQTFSVLLYRVFQEE